MNTDDVQPFGADIPEFMRGPRTHHDDVTRAGFKVSSVRSEAGLSCADDPGF